MKKGEQEAKQILQLKGFEFDDTYCDDNSKQSMPDLRFKNGRYLEVTHTLHNHGNVTHINKFCKKPLAEQLRIMKDAKAVYDRNAAKDYPHTLNGLTDDGLKQLKRDRILIKKHFGLDVSNGTHTEMCDIPIIESSVDNIVREITKDKAPKHSNSDTDLFIFVLEDEYHNDIFNKFLRNKYYISSIANCDPRFMTLMINVVETPQNMYNHTSNEQKEVSDDEQQVQKP